MKPPNLVSKIGTSSISLSSEDLAGKEITVEGSPTGGEDSFNFISYMRRMGFGAGNEHHDTMVRSVETIFKEMIYLVRGAGDDDLSIVMQADTEDFRYNEEGKFYGREVSSTPGDVQRFSMFVAMNRHEALMGLTATGYGDNLRVSVYWHEGACAYIVRKSAVACECARWWNQNIEKAHKEWDGVSGWNLQHVVPEDVVVCTKLMCKDDRKSVVS